MDNVLSVLLLSPLVLLVGYLWFKFFNGYGYGHHLNADRFLFEIIIAPFRRNKKLPFTYGKQATFLSRMALLSVVLVLSVVLAILIKGLYL